MPMEALCAEAVGFDTLYNEHKSARKDHLKEGVRAILEDKDLRSIEEPCQIKPSMTRTSRSSLKPSSPRASGHSVIDVSCGFSELTVRMVNRATEFRQI